MTSKPLAYPFPVFPAMTVLNYTNSGIPSNSMVCPKCSGGVSSRRVRSPFFVEVITRMEQLLWANIKLNTAS